jgi:Na+/H+-dicarboxylate symporter
LKDKLKIADSNARLAACVGTNLNHTGIILYEAVTTIFIAQALGMHLSITQQLGVALASVMAGVGIAGVPDAGLITLPLVLTAGGIANNDINTVLPLLLSVDWIIGRGRAAVNVISDMTVATLLERLDPETEISLDGPSLVKKEAIIELAERQDVAK